MCNDDTGAAFLRLIQSVLYHLQACTGAIIPGGRLFGTTACSYQADMQGQTLKLRNRHKRTPPFRSRCRALTSLRPAAGSWDFGSAPVRSLLVASDRQTTGYLCHPRLSRSPEDIDICIFVEPVGFYGKLCQNSITTLPNKFMQRTV